MTERPIILEGMGAPAHPLCPPTPVLVLLDQDAITAHCDSTHQQKDTHGS